MSSSISGGNGNGANNRAQSQATNSSNRGSNQDGTLVVGYAIPRLKLSPFAYLVLIMLAERAGFPRKGNPRKPVENLDTCELAEICGIGRNTLLKAINELQRRGIISVERGKGKSPNRYTLNRPEKWVRANDTKSTVVVCHENQQTNRSGTPREPLREEYNNTSFLSERLTKNATTTPAVAAVSLRSKGGNGSQKTASSVTKKNGRELSNKAAPSRKVDARRGPFKTERRPQSRREYNAFCQKQGIDPDFADGFYEDVLEGNGWTHATSDEPLKSWQAYVDRFPEREIRSAARRPSLGLSLKLFNPLFQLGEPLFHLGKEPDDGDRIVSQLFLQRCFHALNYRTAETVGRAS